MNEKYLGLTLGAIVAAVTIAVVLLFSKPHAFVFLALVMSSIAAVYLGFTFSDMGRKKDVVIEIANVIAYLALVPLSLWFTPYFLAAGYLWHGIWDAIHHRKLRLIHTKVPEWYIYACMFYDWIIGVFILAWLI